MEEFLKRSNRVSWHNAALGACFQLGLDDETIRCDLPVGDFPLIELINLILFLNGSDFEVEEIPESRHPAPAGMRRVSPAHPTPRAPTYLSNGSYRLPNSKNPPFLRSSSILLSLEPPSAVKSGPPSAAHSSLPSAGKSRPPFTVHSSPPSAARSGPLSAAHSSPPSAGNSRPPSAAHSSPPSAGNSTVSGLLNYVLHV